MTTLALKPVLNMFHGGKLKAMPPKLLSDDKNILPIATGLLQKKATSKHAHQRIPIIPCNLCGSAGKYGTLNIKKLAETVAERAPRGRIDNIFVHLQRRALTAWRSHAIRL